MKNKITFLLIGVLLTVTNALAFEDVEPTYQFAEAINFIKEKNIVQGYPDGTYQATEKINRAELLKIIIESKFSDQEIGSALDEYRSKNYYYVNLHDVDIDSWYAPYVRIGVKYGIIEGYPDGTFGPSKDVNFVEAMKIVMKSYNISFDENSDPWYRDLVDEAGERNLIPLDIISFDLDIDRGQMADLITRTIKYQDGTIDDYLGDAKNFKQSYIEILNGNNNIQYFLDRKKTEMEEMEEEALSGVQLISKSECGDDQSCYKVKVECEGLASREAEIRVNSNENSEGTVFFLGGGYGQSWYGDGDKAASLISEMKEKSFETYEIKWLGEKGWGTDNAGQGLKKLSCGTAEVMRWVVESIADNPDTVGATGHSGGANEIAYGLVVNGLESILDVAVISGGPGRADLVELCCESPQDSTKSLVDYSMGWEGNGDYCKNSCEPEWTVSALRAESLVNSSPEELRDYHYPDTQVVFIEGGRDKYAAQGEMLYDLITSEKSWEVVPNVGHGITNNSDGVALIQKMLLEGLENK